VNPVASKKLCGKLKGIVAVALSAICGCKLGPLTFNCRYTKYKTTPPKTRAMMLTKFLIAASNASRYDIEIAIRA